MAQNISANFTKFDTEQLLKVVHGQGGVLMLMKSRAGGD